MDIVSVKNLTKTFTQGTDKIFALKNVSFSIKPGETVAIIGQSGSGKTTLLNLIGGIEKPTSGNVEIDGISLQSSSDSELSKIRRQKIGYIFQDFNLIPVLTAEENIVMPLLLDSKKINKKHLHSITDFLGITERMKHLPSELSGGQKQRVAIARALINRPGLILADEPTGNLDKNTADEIMQLLLEINRNGTTVILVTHEEKYADMCQRKLYISDGIISET
ncbi:MAG: ABC transporter ATP-binding protein [Oscillospiraceae bacterium]|nr:ABC transporter ATP-binding protein [Oscillospiraceae bacterium]